MDALIVLALLLALIVPFAMKRLWWWVGLWISVALIELAAKLFSGHTLSQHFWAAAHLDPTWAYITAAIILTLALIFTTHLLWKELRRKRPPS